MSYVQLPPDGAGKKIHTKINTVDGTVVETQVLHLCDPNSPSNLLNIDNVGSASVRFAEGQPIMSGFGSMKTTHERVLGVYESSLDTYESLFSVITSGVGSLGYAPTESSQVLTVDGTAGSLVRIVTNRYHYYNPGTSNLYKMTVSTGDSGKVGNTRRWGAFDTNDGVFFELKDTEFNVVIRSSVGGSISENRIARANWNKDKLDGLGRSGHTLDLTKINVFWIDYQWLGAGRVRFGIYAPNGDRVECHRFNNAGSNTMPYMRTGALPAALENVNTGTTGSVSQLRNVCIGVYSEGTYEDYAFWRFSDIDSIGVSVTTNTPMASVRTKQIINGKHNSVILYPETLNFYTTEPVALTMWQNTVVTGGAWDGLASAGDVNYGGTVDTSGSQKFKTLYFGTGAHSVDLDKFFEKNDEGVQINADGSYEVWSFLATRLTANATTCSMNLGYKELW